VRDAGITGAKEESLRLFPPRFPSCSFPRAATLGLALLLAASLASASATTVSWFSVRRVGSAVEVDFAVLGAVPRWYLQNHVQELWLDLNHSQVRAVSEAATAPGFFPVARVSMRDFGGGRARLTIRVQGRVDYAVAQMPHDLVVRIAPAGRSVDLAQRLFSEMPGRVSASSTPAPSVDRGGYSARRAAQSMIEEGAQRTQRETVELSNSPLSAGSARTGPKRAFEPNPARGAAFGGGAGPGLTRDENAQMARAVTGDIAVAPSFGPDGAGPLVAIDAGHGGFDPGTESAGGVAEKTIALAIARRLAAALEARGLRAELTRNDDVFLSLEQRTELANRAHADLFVSIHLNSSPDWNTSGIETYYLNNTTDKSTIRLARIENGADYGLLPLSNLNYILANLRQDYKAHEASSLARMIEAESADTIDTTLGIKVTALGAKMGPFYVLVGAEMPSVLVECGFLSNPQEAQFLSQAGYQQALADGIALAILRYFNADTAVGNL
jgi:N-acetylmuramoyl-L-alanine amidase